MRLALVGDVHGVWGDPDVEQIDRLGYAAVLVTGDLPGRLHRDTLAVARAIARLRTPVYAIAGNHDGTAPLQVAAEALDTFRDLPWHQRLQRLRVAELDEALRPHVLGGYSLHTLSDGDLSVDLLVARPHAMGGAHLTFRAWLRERYGVASMEESAERLKALVDEARHPIVVLCHNGPRGLGVGGPWGLSRQDRDLGDLDLAEAVAHAHATGKRVLAVCGGHVHHGRDRAWRVERDGVLYVNAARVPRVFRYEGRTVRHHVRLHLDARGAVAEELLLPDD